MKIKNLTSCTLVLTVCSGNATTKKTFTPGQEIDVSPDVVDSVEHDNRVRQSRGLKPNWKINRPPKKATKKEKN